MIGALVARKAVAEGFEALNRHDLAKFMSNWRDDAVLIYPGETPASGTFSGKAAVEGWFRRFFDQFPRIQIDIQEICVRNIFALGGNNVLAVHWDAHLTNREGREAQNSGVTVIHIKGGKAVLSKDYIFDLGETFRVNWG